MGKKAYITYRCSLCGHVTIADNPSDIPRATAPEFIGKVIRNQQMMGNPELYKAPFYAIHNCIDGNCGLLQFAGIAYM